MELQLPLSDQVRAKLKSQHHSRNELLLALCRRDAAHPGVLSEATLSQLDDSERRADFLEYASRHGVMGLVAGVLVRNRLLKQGPAFAEMDTHLRAMSRRAMIMQLERDNVLRVLETVGMDAVLLKGAGLVSTVYGALADRDYGDIDILVPPTQINAAVAALSARGYGAPSTAAVNEGYRAHHFHVRVQRAAIIVELHWALTLAREPYALDGEAVMRQAVRHTAVPSARVPAAEDMLLHMVVENARDAFTRLTRLVDIDRIVVANPQLDWDYLETCARNAHLAPSLWLTLTTSVSMLGTPVPAQLLQRLQPTAALRWHLGLFNVPQGLLTQRGVERPSWKLLLQLWLVNDRSRSAALARLLRGDDDEPLEWLWKRESEPRDITSSTTKRAVRTGKLLAYQMWLYVAKAR